MKPHRRKQGYIADSLVMDTSSRYVSRETEKTTRESFGYFYTITPTYMLGKYGYQLRHKDSSWPISHEWCHYDTREEAIEMGKIDAMKRGLKSNLEKMLDSDKPRNFIGGGIR